jgi:hypothetical protein
MLSKPMKENSVLTKFQVTKSTQCKLSNPTFEVWPDLMPPQNIQDKRVKTS